MFLFISMEVMVIFDFEMLREINDDEFKWYLMFVDFFLEIDDEL